MKKQIIIYTIITLVSVYIGFSFVELQLNPLQWSKNIRIAYACVVCASDLIGCLLLMSHENSEKWEYCRELDRYKLLIDKGLITKDHIVSKKKPGTPAPEQ